MTFWFYAVIVVLIDQISKYFALKYLNYSVSYTVLAPILFFTRIHNRGAAFGIMSGSVIVFIIFSFLVIALFLIFQKKILSLEKSIQICLGLVMGGCIGNLIDRIRFNYVVDFIDFKVWPVFNFADSALTLSVTYLIIYFIVLDIKDRKR